MTTVALGTAALAMGVATVVVLLIVRANRPQRLPLDLVVLFGHIVTCRRIWSRA